MWEDDAKFYFMNGFLESVQHFGGSHSSKRPGDRVSVKYIRDKQLITVSVTLKKDSN